MSRLFIYVSGVRYIFLTKPISLFDMLDCGIFIFIPFKIHFLPNTEKAPD
jgi:hypothetical protein